MNHVTSLVFAAAGAVLGVLLIYFQTPHMKSGTPWRAAAAVPSSSQRSVTSLRETPAEKSATKTEIHTTLKGDDWETSIHFARVYNEADNLSVRGRVILKALREGGADAVEKSIGMGIGLDGLVFAMNEATEMERIELEAIFWRNATTTVSDKLMIIATMMRNNSAIPNSLISNLFEKAESTFVSSASAAAIINQLATKGYFNEIVNFVDERIGGDRGSEWRQILQKQISTQVAKKSESELNQLMVKYSATLSSGEYQANLRAIGNSRYAMMREGVLPWVFSMSNKQDQLQIISGVVEFYGGVPRAVDFFQKSGSPYAGQVIELIEEIK